MKMCLLTGINTIHSTHTAGCHWVQGQDLYLLTIYCIVSQHVCFEYVAIVNAATLFVPPAGVNSPTQTGPLLTYHCEQNVIHSNRVNLVMFS